MRVVLDTNVWVSGWLWGGVPGQLIIMADNQQIAIYASEALLIELETTLERGKLQKKIQSLGSTVEILISRTRQLVKLCPPTSVDVPQLRDQDDAIILATAVAANAEVIVTGDQDLLTLNEYEGILIMTVTEFLDRYLQRAGE